MSKEETTAKVTKAAPRATKTTKDAADQLPQATSSKGPGKYITPNGATLVRR